MSSTGRSDVRDPEDHYQTPAWAVRAVLPHLPPLGGLRILEPSAGRGAIVKALIEAGASPDRLHAVEINAERMAAIEQIVAPCADGIKRSATMSRTSFEEYAAREFVGRFDLVVMNHPFILAEAHIRLALSLLAPGGTVAALCRLAFLSEGQERAAFRRECPHDRVELVRRPSFTAESLAYLTDADLRAMATAEEVEEALKKAASKRAKPMTMDERIIGIVRARLRRTDSCAYAWGLWGEGRGGRFWTHEERDGL